MPELPEVETTKRMCTAALKGQRLREVLIKSDPIVFAGISSTTVRKNLLGQKVLSLERKGKYFWLNLESGKSLLIHLGMTGRMRTDVSKSEYTRSLKMVLGTGKKSVALFDGRRFGRVRLVEDIEKEPRIIKLGEDALDGKESASSLRGRLATRSAPIKAVLLDQTIFAGVGNWIADEVLYQARIAPTRPAKSLTLAETKKVKLVLKRILRTAVAARADYHTFPKNWLFHHRWGKRKDAMTSKKEHIKHTTIGGRTTAWVPAIQK